MKVWVTGARGFIGRHLARRLAVAGHRVSGLGHGTWPEDDHRQWGVGDWGNGEITHANLDALAGGDGLPDAVMHLAGGSAVGPSLAQPAEDFRRSVATTSELADWLRLRSPLTRLVMASSAAVYGAAHAGAIAESALCAPFSPYGFHKRMAELCLESYARNFGLRVAVVRLFSVYGEGLRKQLLWDACSKLAHRPRQLDLGGSGAELRDWVYVDDAVGLLAAAERVAGAECPVLNGGTGIATPIRDIASHLCRCWGSEDLPIHFSGEGRPGDPPALIADPTAAMALGWQPSTRWEEGVRGYVEWFRSLSAERRR